MKKRLSNLFSSLVLCTILLAFTLGGVNAQALVNDGIVTLADLGVTEINLTGPYDTSTLSYGLPADWKFTGNAKIDLNITTTFNSVTQGNETGVAGGTLAVSFNRTTIKTLVLDQIGTFDYSIDIPAELLISPRADGQMELKFTLNSGISCLANQRMNVVINSSSRTTFLYEEQLPDTALINFPRPIIQETIFPDQALIVIPDEPTATELQSAFTIASGLGNLSSNKLALELVTVGQLTDQQKTASHLIFVGKASTLPILADLALPLELQGGAFVFPDGSEDNGAIQMTNSPWALKNVVLVVSGNSDLGTLKAAQAVSTGIFQENSSPNLAIVEGIQETAGPAPLVTDQSFEDMGFDTRQFTNRGIDSQTYSFYIPSGSSLATDAYVELAFGNSALLDYARSGLVVLLNGQPIGSVKFSEATAGQAVNRVRISIPSSVTIPGDNRIEVRAGLEPLDFCTDPNLRGLWSVVWSDSRLHLPFTSSQLSTPLSLDLSAYPAPMTFDSTLGTTAVVFQRTDLASWRNFTRVASYLGDRSNGAITKLAVFFDDEVAGADLSQYNVIVIGRPSQLAIMDELNAVLPVPFEAGSDTTQGQFLQVNYQMPPEVPVGYIELATSPWNNEKALIAAFGNTDTGLGWGISALVDSPLRSQLAGDFAVINQTRVQAIDTRLVVPVANSPAEQTDPVNTTPQIQPITETVSTSRPAWLLPALVVSIVLIVIVIVIAMAANVKNNRKTG